MSKHDAEDDALDVCAALQKIADAASVPPPWRDALPRLQGELTAEERLAIYQTVRDSGWLSNEEGFYLVSSHVEDMADSEAMMQLQDLEARTAELEHELEKQVAEAGEQAETLDAYEEAAREYQDGWDAIFVSKLKAFGEQQIAFLYEQQITDSDTGNHDEFAWRYDAGLRSLQVAADLEHAASSDDLIQVAASVDPSRAYLMQMELNNEGIPSAIGNANFVSWYWHYSNATGGVTLDVRRGDAQRARNVLETAHAEHPMVMPPWTCPNCGQRVAGQWELCWRCGSSPDSATGDMPDKEQTPSKADVGDTVAATVARLWGAAAMLLLVLLPFMLGRVLPAIYFAPLVFIFIFLMMRMAPPASWRGESEETPPKRGAAVDDLATSQTNVRNVTAQRAWQAAVIALVAFPPLGFYALWLLGKLARRNLPLVPADRWRTRLAFVFSVLAILICLMIAAGLIRLA